MKSYENGKRSLLYKVSKLGVRCIFGQQYQNAQSGCSKLPPVLRGQCVTYCDVTLHGGKTFLSMESLKYWFGFVNSNPTGAQKLVLIIFGRR